MTEVDLNTTNATVTNITTEVVNMFYVIVLTIRKFADLIILIGIISGVAIGIQAFLRIMGGMFGRRG